MPLFAPPRSNAERRLTQPASSDYRPTHLVEEAEEERNNSGIISHCRKIMLGGRAVLRRGRQRRVLSKHITRTSSQNNIDNSVKILIPAYFYAIILLIAFACFSWNFVAIASVTYFVFRLVILPPLSVRFSRYHKRAQGHGPSIREKWYYYLDYWISTNPYSKALVLLLLTLGLILSSGSIISWMADEPWVESLWAAALGSGLDWGFVNSYNPTLRFVAVCTNVGGLVLTALLLSLISDAVQTKYDSLRKGESVVTEIRHTLLIGWSVKALSVMTQIAKSGASVGNRNNVIVCLTDQREKEDMENDIANYDFSFANNGTRVVCRSGSPLMYQELRKVSFCRAKSIIILGDDENDAETNDARSLQILLSIVAALEREKVDFLAKVADMSINRENSAAEQPGRRNVELQPPRPDRIVIEVMDTENAGIMKSVCPGLVEPVLAHDVVGRLLLQAARNPLVADVWQELLGFDGCEIYSAQWGILRGLTFGEVLLCFEDAIPLGVKTKTGGLHLNPDDSYIISEGDEIVVLAEDEESYCASISHPLIREKVPDDMSRAGYRFVDICAGGLRAISTFSDIWVTGPAAGASRLSSRDIYGLDVERILFCGWRFDMGNLLQVFSAVAPVGSEFWILCELDVEERQSELRLRGWECNNRVKVVHRVGSCRRNVLAQLPLEAFTSVIVGGAEASGQAKWYSPKNAESTVPGGKPETGGPDARVITVVMMIQDIISRRNFVDAKEVIARGASSSIVPDEFDEITSPSSSSLNASRGLSALGNEASISSGNGMGRSQSSGGEDVSHKRSTHLGLARARSQKFLGAKNTTECTAPRGVIVGEIVDSRSRAMLSMVNSIDAVVASSELISKAVAMVSEDSSVNRVLNTLFDPYDSEITLEGVERYINADANERLSFFEMMARGRRLGTIVLGYLERELVTAEVGDMNPSTIRYIDVALNPPNKDVRRGWHVDDLLIVLTPGASETTSAPDTVSEPNEFLADVENVKTLDITKEFSWDEELQAPGSKARVRFSNQR